jgi:DNA-binding CsgD family transcriptional regulator
METFLSRPYPQQVLPRPGDGDGLPGSTVAPAVVEGAALPMDLGLEDVPEAIIVLDASMRVAAWNRAASIVTGFPASAALGGVCSFEGDTLTIDTDVGCPPALAPPPATAARRLWEFHVKDFGGPREDVVAAVVPLGHADLGFYLHLVPRVRGEGVPGAVPAGGRGRSIDALTPREREILKLLAAGKTAKPIAAQLSLSVPTVRTHIQHILRKLSVHSCLEAAVVFLRSGGMLAVNLAALLAAGVAEIV